MKRLSPEEVDTAIAALERACLPSYAVRALRQLEGELRAALSAEAKLGEFRDTVAEAVRTTDPLGSSVVPYNPGDLDAGQKPQGGG